MNFIPRHITPHILEVQPYYPVTVVNGPRQTGKTTLCRHLFPAYSFYNLEDISLRQSIAEDPLGFLDACGDKCIIDEAQRYPDLLSYIQVCSDKNPDRRFILTGSSNYLLMQSVTQSLAGRAAVFTLLPFSLAETQTIVAENTDTLLCHGFFPGVLARNISPEIFFPNYITTYIERDVRTLKEISNLGNFQTFMRLLATRVGTEFNASSISSQMGITSPTIMSWLGVLETSYITFRLPPFFRNLNKRLVKTPKVYFTDCGLLCSLLGINNAAQLASHPLKGEVFENMVITEFLKGCHNAAKRPALYFYRESSGKEVDLIREVSIGNVEAYEVKSSSTYNSAFSANLNHLAKLLGSELTVADVIYSGAAIPPRVRNFRDTSLYIP